MSLLIVGSIAVDSIETVYGKVDRIIGGAATHACYAASLFTKTSLVGAVGDDFPLLELKRLQRRGANVDGVQIIPGGKTFHWGGVYADDFSTRKSLFTHLGVFEDFSPK